LCKYIAKEKLSDAVVITWRRFSDSSSILDVYKHFLTAGAAEVWFNLISINQGNVSMCHMR
jgi:hypothetical protein